MSLKRSINFSLNARKGKVENLPIRMRITYKSERIDIPLGYNVDLNYWNTKTQRVKDGATNNYGQTSIEINKSIADALDKADRLFKRYELNDETPTPKEVKDACMALFSKKNSANSVSDIKELGFFDRFDEFVKDKGTTNNWTTATYTKFKAVRSHLLEFNSNLGVDDFSEQTLSEYVRFLQVTKKMRNTTIGKQLGFLKWFLRWMDAKGHSTQKAYITFKPKFKTSEHCCPIKI